jgi:hypothetical protein
MSYKDTRKGEMNFEDDRGAAGEKTEDAEFR